MKNNTPFFLAYSAIKKDKKNYLLSFLIMLIAFTFTITFISLINTEETVDRKAKEQKYGNWLLCIENLNQENVDYLKINHGEDFVGDMKVISKLHTNHYVGNYDKTFFELASIELMDGRLPSKSHEIISIQGKNHLGDQVTIDNQRYQVVGLINEYNQYWEGPSFDYFTYNLPTDRNFVYYSTQESIHQFIEGANTKVTYNYPLIPGKYLISECSSANLSQNMNNLLYTSQSPTDTLNYFIILIGIALLVAIFYNIQEREKTVFLFRCIGMSKSDMRKYIFYEMIVIAFIALGISVVIGLLLSLCVSLYYYYQSQIFVYTTSLWLSMKYIGFIILMIIGVTYLSLLTISIHAMDGLVHKVQRKKLKKYHKHKYMSVHRLANRIVNKHWNLFGPICLLMIVQFFLVVSIIDAIKVIPDSYQEPNYYRYNFNFYDEDMIYKIQDEIIELNTTKYVVNSDYNMTVHDNSLGLIEVFDNPSIFEDKIEQGRLPRNAKECLYLTKGYDLEDESRINIGDTVRVTKSHHYETQTVIMDGEEYEEPKEEFYDEFKIVGISLMEDIYDEYKEDKYISFYDNGIATYADCFDKKDIGISTNLVTKHDVFLDINDYQNMSYNERNNSMYSFKSIDNTSYEKDVLYRVMIRIPLMLTCIVFMYFIMSVLLNIINKDINLIRCLGMTKRQTTILYLWCGIYIFCHYSIWIWVYWGVLMPMYYLIENETWIISLYLAIGIHLLFFVIWAHKKTENTLTFYPTDVERYY